MPLVRRMLSYTLIQMIIELAVILLLVVLLRLLFALLPKGFLSNVLLANVFSNWVLTLLVVAWFLLAARFLEHRSLAEVGLPRQHLVRDLVLGFALGACLMASIIGVLALAGWYRIPGVESAGNIVAPLFATFLIFLAVAIFEEILFRGVAFRLLEQAFGSWIAVILSALFFGFSHLVTPHATLVGALAIAATGGVASAGIYMLTRNLWSVFGLHWAWNFFEGPIFGAQVSGRGTPVLLHSVTNGPVIWTGGAFGPEAGLVTILIGGAVAVILLVLAVRRRCIITPRWLQPARSVPASS